MDLNVLGDTLEDAGLFNKKKANPIYDLRDKGITYKVMSTAFKRMKSQKYILGKDLISYVKKNLPEHNEKQILSVLYGNKHFSRKYGVWMRVSPS